MSAPTEKKRINSRRKGGEFERVVLAGVRKHWPLARRGQQSSNRMGSVEPDILGPPGFWIECNKSRDPRIPLKATQALKDNFKRSRSPCRHVVLVIGLQGTQKALVLRYMNEAEWAACCQENHPEVPSEVGMNAMRIWAFTAGLDCGRRVFDEGEQYEEVVPIVKMSTGGTVTRWMLKTCHVTRVGDVLREWET